MDKVTRIARLNAHAFFPIKNKAYICGNYRSRPMKYIIALSTLLSVAFMSLVLRVDAHSTAHRTKDSLRRVIAQTEGADRTRARERLARIYIKNLRHEGVLDTLLALYDTMESEARTAGDFASVGVVQNNRITAYYNKGLNDEVIAKAPAVLGFLAENGLWKDFYQTSNNVCEAYRRKREYDKALEAAEKTYHGAKERNDRGGMGMTQLAIAKIYSDLRRYSEAEKCIRDCIDLLQNQKSYLNYLATAYNRLAVSLIGQERYDEALEVARATEDVNRRYEQASHSPQPSAWFNLWLIYVDIYRQTGAYDKALAYADKIDSITNGSVRMYKERGHILYGKRHYAQALEMLDSAIRASPNALEPKGLKLMTLAQMREPDKAVQLFSEVIGELESRHNERFNARLDELRTQYEVDKLVAEKKRSRNNFLFALGGCLLLVVLLGVTCYYNRVITRKNIGLFNRIKEQDRTEEELAQLRMLYEQPIRNKISVEHREEPELGSERQQRELVVRLHEYLLRDRNFVHAEINRDELISALGTNKNLLSEAVKAVAGKTPMEYIRTMQLEEARRLLDRHPELTVESIAFDCGFNAPNTFYRQFRKYYGISPAQYRKLADTCGN